MSPCDSSVCLSLASCLPAPPAAGSLLSRPLVCVTAIPGLEEAAGDKKEIEEAD